ncbi:uncharacterized protein LOC110987305 [Acanthaster planci]|uniref:Uncharacterized protein LOC110987305 n=1 Tax=Acanthaster planci TaxID=133434 RepID=A0A8B7ZL37_ACAPL|nr:uncharacterized protein LOC110987305 [Acanthaster planci]
MSSRDWEYNLYTSQASEGKPPQGGRLTDDEDEDYDAEEPERMYHLDLSSRIKEKFHRRLVKTGIPRRPGFYQIQTSRSMAKPSGHFYSGKHWEMAPQSADKCDVRALQKPLERTTRRLTICAVNQACDFEQHRRMKNEAREMQQAGSLLSPLNKEFKRIIAFNEEEQQKEEMGKRQALMEDKDCVMAQLLYRDNAKNIQQAVEEERHRRMTIMSELTDEEKSSGDANFREMLRSLSKVSKLWQEIQDELSNAVHDLEEVHEEENHAIGDIFNELKDDFVLSFKRATLLMKFHMAEENERRHRVNEARLLSSGKKKLDPVQRRSSYMKDLTQQELVRVFNSVVMAENEKEEKEEVETDQHKMTAMEEMLRRHSIKEADHACALERVRRIQEAEDEVQPGARRDPLKERIKDMMVDVQEQMLLQIFRGHKVRHAEPRDIGYYAGESSQDRKLRTLRTQSRRKSCVVSGY